MDETVTVVENGASRATIVLAPDIGPIGTAAVHDLVRVIAVMSGAALPVVRDGGPVAPGAQVHVGQTTFARDAGLLPDGLPVNGYRIVTVHAAPAPRLVITAPHAQGISHGIYDLLTNVLGAMWGMADALFEDIPLRHTVRVGRIDRTERPAFGFRVFSGTSREWERRSRIDVEGNALPRYGHGHNLHNIIAPERHRDHPEYFALIDGERQVPQAHEAMGPQPCLTHPDVIRITIEAVRRFFDGNPETTTFSLCPNDSDRFCRCPTCAALDDGMPRYRGRRMTSDSYFHYVNAVATEVMKTHPDRYLGTYARWTTELPPRRIARLPPNVVVYLAQDSSQYFDREYEAQDRDLLDAWSKMAHHLVVCDCYGLGWFTPRYYPGIVGRTLSCLPTPNVEGFYAETYPFWAHMGPMLYLAAQLLWNPARDPRAVMDEWFGRMFAESAAHMRAFYEVLERTWMTLPRRGAWSQGLDKLWEQVAFWPPRPREEAWRHLDAAHAAARTNRTRTRVEYVRRAHRFAYLVSHAHEAAHAVRPDTSHLAGRIRHVLRLVDDTISVFHRELEGDPNYPAAYCRGPRSYRQLNWWRGDIAACIEEALAGNAALRDRLVAEDATLSEIVRIAADDEVKGMIGRAYADWAEFPWMNVARPAAVAAAP